MYTSRYSKTLSPSQYLAENNRPELSDRTAFNGTNTTIGNSASFRHTVLPSYCVPLQTDEKTNPRTLEQVFLLRLASQMESAKLRLSRLAESERLLDEYSPNAYSWYQAKYMDILNGIYNTHVELNRNIEDIADEEMRETQLNNIFDEFKKDVDSYVHSVERKVELMRQYSRVLESYRQSPLMRGRFSGTSLEALRAQSMQRLGDIDTTTEKCGNKYSREQLAQFQKN